MAGRTGQVKLTKTDRVILESYIPVVQDLAVYLGSSYEIVLHSLEDYDHSVIAIVNGAHTGRTVGAPITDLALDMLDVLSQGKPSTAYFSTNKKGEPLKSTTIAIRGEHDRIVGLLCINLYLNTPLSEILADLTPDRFAGVSAPARETFASNTGELIEAALDDVNVVRYAQYLRRMTENTQFIVITHRRGTMEAADVLYGVTMQEDGVSKILRLDLNNVSADLIS